jgi:hypothetical protein
LKIGHNAKSTLTGVNYRELTEILTGAAIHFLEEITKLRETGQDPEMSHYCETKLKQIRCIEVAIRKAISDTFGPPTKPTKAQRWRAVQESENERRIIENVMLTFAQRLRYKRYTHSGNGGTA